MAVSKKTKAQLNTLHADNSTGDISPEDNRQIVETMHFPLMHWWQDSGDSTARTFAASDTYYELLSASADTTKYSHKFTDVGDDPVFTYSATPQQTVCVWGVATVTAGAADKDYSIALAVDDTVEAHTATTFNYHTSGAKQQVWFGGMITMSNTEELSVYVRADGHTTTITFDRIAIMVLSPAFAPDEVSP